MKKLNNYPIMILDVRSLISWLGPLS